MTAHAAERAERVAASRRVEVDHPDIETKSSANRHPTQGRDQAR